MRSCQRHFRYISPAQWLLPVCGLWHLRLNYLKVVMRTFHGGKKYSDRIFTAYDKVFFCKSHYYSRAWSVTKMIWAKWTDLKRALRIHLGDPGHCDTSLLPWVAAKLTDALFMVCLSTFCWPHQTWGNEYPDPKKLQKTNLKFEIIVQE